MEKYFFDIPVFRCSPEQLSEEKSKEELKLAEQTKLGDAVTDKDIQNAKSWLSHNFTSYRYSELIGMIRLYSMPGQIRAEVFYVTNKRLVRNQKNKKWSHMGKLLEFSVFPEMTNEEIYDWTITKLKRECGASYLKKRFVELSCFEVSGPYIDYRKLTNIN